MRPAPAAYPAQQCLQRGPGRRRFTAPARRNLLGAARRTLGRATRVAAAGVGVAARTAGNRPHPDPPAPRAAPNLRRTSNRSSMNHCLRGQLGIPPRECRCTSDQVARYPGRPSSTLLGSIDRLVEVAVLQQVLLAAPAAGESNATSTARAAQVRALAPQRQGRTNARLGPRQIDAYAVSEPAALALQPRAATRLGGSGRGHFRALTTVRPPPTWPAAPASTVQRRPRRSSCAPPRPARCTLNDWRQTLSAAPPDRYP